MMCKLYINIFSTLSGTAEDVDKFSRRTVRVTRQHNQDCQKLLKLMGVPFVIVSRIFLFPLA
jgi:hypothetical protein